MPVKDRLPPHVRVNIYCNSHCLAACRQGGAAPLLAALALRDAGAAALAARLLRFSVLQAPAAPSSLLAPGEAAGAAAPSPGPSLPAAVADGLAGAAAAGLVRTESGAQLLAELVMTLPLDARSERLQAVLRRLTDPHAHVKGCAEGGCGEAGPGSQAAVAATVSMLLWPCEDAEDAVLSAALKLPNGRAASPVLAAALALLPAAESVPRLVRMLGASARGAERAAASKLLLAVLLGPGDVVGALQALLQAVRGSGKAHTTSGAAAGATGGGSDAGQPDAAGASSLGDAAAEHAADVLRVWGERVGRTRGAALAPGIAAEVLCALWAAPADGAVVKALAALGRLFGEHPAPLLAGVRARLAQQPALPGAEPAGPRAGGAHQSGQAPSEGNDGQLFERLAPLIALRTLPAAALEVPEAAGCLYGSGEAAVAYPGNPQQTTASSGERAPAAGAAAAAAQGGSVSAGEAHARAAPGSDLAGTCGAGGGAGSAAWQQHPRPGSVAAALLQRMASAGELPEVRRQAAELMGRMAAPGAERAVVSLVTSGAKSGDTLALRAGLFAMCAALSARGARALALHDAGALSRVLCAIASALRWPQARATPLCRNARHDAKQRCLMKTVSAGLLHCFHTCA